MKEFKDKQTWILEELEMDENEDHRSWKSWIVHHTKDGGYVENEVTINAYDDGDISLWDDDEAVYLTKEQVNHFIEILRIKKHLK